MSLTAEDIARLRWLMLSACIDDVTSNELVCEEALVHAAPALVDMADECLRLRELVYANRLTEDEAKLLNELSYRDGVAEGRRKMRAAMLGYLYANFEYDAADKLDRHFATADQDLAEDSNLIAEGERRATAAIVAWIRAATGYQPLLDAVNELANLLERGEHLKASGAK